MTEDSIVVKGKVIKLLPGAKFKVELENGAIITAYLSGKMMKNHIMVIEGDKVEVALSVYDLTNGRITYRYK